MRGHVLFAGLVVAAFIPTAFAAQPAAPDQRGDWVTGQVLGHYDDNGRWIDGPAIGHYGRDGAWQPGAGDSAASADAGPSGYYDAWGRWVAAAPSADQESADVAYTDRDPWAGAPLETRAREDWLERRIRDDRAAGRLDGDDAGAALARLDAIREVDQRYRSYSGELSPREEATIEGRLDDLRRRVDAFTAR